jgi:hypothetical protein
LGSPPFGGGMTGHSLEVLVAATRRSDSWSLKRDDPLHHDQHPTVVETAAGPDYVRFLLR